MSISFNILLIPIVLAAVQIVKQFFPEPTDSRSQKIWDGITFLSSIIIGIGLSWLIDGLAFRQTILEGLLAGLTASGLYTGGKVSGRAIGATVL